MYRSMMKIDGNKLTREIEKRGLIGRAMSVEMGYAASYISCCTNRGHMSTSGLKMLEKLYDIRPDEIMPDKEPETIPEPEQMTIPEPPADPINYERLGQVIYQAVYEAVKKAWAE